MTVRVREPGRDVSGAPIASTTSFSQNARQQQAGMVFAGLVLQRRKGPVHRGFNGRQKPL